MNGRVWTDADDEQLRHLYPRESADRIAVLIGRSKSAVYGRATKLGLEKPDGWAAQCARWRWAEGKHEGSRRRHFPKGHAPANKGLRRPGYGPGRMKETQFKKGQMSGAAHHNYVPIGTVKFDPKRKVLVRKITDNQAIYPAARWQPIHRMVWEAVHGKVPPGHIVVFRRGMKTFTAAEITIEKLELVTLAENMRRNSMHNYPEPIKDAMRLVGTVKRQVRKLHGKEQH